MTVFAILKSETDDSLKLQKNTDRLGCWARKWGMRFQLVKCNIMQIIGKRTNKTEVSYTLEGMVLENVDSIKYLGVTITHDMNINHINNMCSKDTKANRTLGFFNVVRMLKRQHIGDSFAPLWNMAAVFGVVLQEIEKVQNRNALPDSIT